MDLKDKPPASEEVEISVFGPGFGECILLHVGFGKWIVVDSCIDPITREPSALSYLKRIKVSPEAVCQVIATHWHDDHVKGLAQVVKACGRAQFVCSDAFREPELRTLVAAYARSASFLGTSGVEEFYDILMYLRNLGRHPKLAHEDQRLLNEDSSVPTELWALSPSSYSIINATVQMRQLMPLQGTQKKRVHSPKPNHTAVVLWCRVGSYAFLFGADLEVDKNPSGGWLPIVQSQCRPRIPPQSHIFKIPHHGSKNGHEHAVWKTMLKDNPLCILTPWTLGGKLLPRGSDLDRIRSLTNQAYATAPAYRPKPQKFEDSAVQRTIKEATRKFQRMEPDTGHVRVRFSINDGNFAPNVEVFGPAHQI